MILVDKCLFDFWRIVFDKKSTILIIILLLCTTSLFCQSYDTSSLKYVLIKSQISYYNAQAQYYNRQSNLTTLISSSLSIVGTLAGATIAFLGITYQARRQKRLEQEKWERARKEDERKYELIRAEETRKESYLAAADLMKKIATAVRSMTWLLWTAAFDEEHLTKELFEDHDKNMKVIFIEIAAAEVVLAAVNKPFYDKVKPIIKNVFFFDGRISRRSLNIEYQGVLENWHDIRKQVLDFFSTIPDSFSEMVMIRKNPET